MCGALHLRQARVRHVLSHRGYRQDEVLDEVERRQVHAAEGRLGLRQHLRELLRCVHGERLRGVTEWRIPR